MENKKEIYHGSANIIEQPVWGAGNPKNDYGLGFYCTPDAELAKEWATTEKENGFSNQYLLDMTDLSVLNLNSGQYHILNWIAVLLENRIFRLREDVAVRAKEYILENFWVDYKKYDIVNGYRADDSYFSYANSFLNNTLSLDKLEKRCFMEIWENKSYYVQKGVCPIVVSKSRDCGQRNILSQEIGA